MTKTKASVRYLAQVAGQQASVLVHGFHLFAGQVLTVTEEEAAKLRSSGLVQILEQPLESGEDATPDPATPAAPVPEPKTE